MWPWQWPTGDSHTGSMRRTRPLWVTVTTSLALVVIAGLVVVLVALLLRADISGTRKLVGLIATVAIAAGASIRIVIASRPYGDPKR